MNRRSRHLAPWEKLMAMAPLKYPGFLGPRYGEALRQPWMEFSAPITGMATVEDYLLVVCGGVGYIIDKDRNILHTMRRN